MPHPQSEVSFVDEKERTYFAQAKVGEQVREFLHSPVGRLLHGRAKQMMHEAQEEALAADVGWIWGRRKLRKAQEKAAIARAFMGWCADAIIEGEHAGNELANYRG